MVAGPFLQAGLLRVRQGSDEPFFHAFSGSGEPSSHLLAHALCHCGPGQSLDAARGESEVPLSLALPLALALALPLALALAEISGCAARVRG